MLILKIGEYKIDISELDIQFIYELISGLGERSSNFTFNVNLLNTQTLDSIVSCLYSVYDEYKVDKRYNEKYNSNEIHVFNVLKNNPCQILFNEGVMFDGYFTINQVTGKSNTYEYELSFFGDSMKWLIDIDFHLNEIEGEEICYDSTLVSSYDNIMCFPFIEYGNFTNNMSLGSPLIDIENLYPAYFIKNLIKVGFEKINYTVIDDFFVGDKANLIIPFTNEWFKSKAGVLNNEIGYYTNETNYQIVAYFGSGNPNNQYNTNYTFIPYFITYSNETITYETFPGLYVFENNSSWTCGDVQVCIKVQYGFEFIGNGVGSGLRVTADLISSIDGILVTNTDNIAFNEGGNYNKEIEWCGLLSYGAKVWVQYTMRAISIFVGNIAAPYEGILTYSNMFVSLQDYKENLLFNTYDNTPDITFRELLSDLTKMFNLMFVTDNEARNVFITDYNNFITTVEEVNNKDGYLDWSQKVDLNNDDLITFNTISQVDLNYLPDTDNLSTIYKQTNDNRNYGDYQIVISDYVNETQTLSLETFSSSQSYSVIFSGTAYSLQFDIIELVEYQAVLPLADKTNWNTRILYFNPTIVSGAYWLIGSTFGTVTSVVMTFPLCYFDGLEFETLYNNHYANYIDLTTNHKFIEKAMNLNIDDCETKSFALPIFIMGNWYRLQRINGLVIKGLSRAQFYLI